MPEQVRRALVVDDHAVVRRGLREILADAFPSLQTEEAADGRIALSMLLERAYDLVLLDVSMPCMNGLEVLARLRAERPSLPVLVLSIHSEDQYAIQALRAGAFGFLTKAAAPEELVHAVGRLLRGERYISATVAEAVAQRFELEAEGPLHERLSLRELEVFRRIAAGTSVKGAAEALGLSCKTVSTYRTRILEKLGARTNSDLTQYAVKNGLLELEP